VDSAGARFDIDIDIDADRAQLSALYRAIML